MLTASLLPSPLGGHISVSITTSFNGEDICRVELPGGTLADLEKALFVILMDRCSGLILGLASSSTQKASHRGH